MQLPQIKPHSLDYDVKEYKGHKFQYQMQTQQNGSNNITLTRTGNAETIVNIPDVVFSPGNSYIEFDISLPASGNNPTGSSKLWTSCAPFESVGLFSSYGTPIWQCTSYNLVSKAVGPLLMTEGEMQNRSSIVLETAALGNARNLNPPLQFLHPSGYTVASTGPAGNQFARINASGDIMTASSIAARLKPVVSSQEYVASPLDDEQFYTCRFNFSDIPHSRLASKKLLYGRNALQLRLQWLPYDNIAFQSASVGANNSPITLPSAPAITNFRLMLAVEQNEEEVKRLKDMVNSPQGYTEVVPWVSVNRWPLGTATSTSVQQVYDSSQGRTLLRVYSVPYISSNILNTTARMNNLDLSMFSSFYTMKNSERIQQENLDTLFKQYSVVKPLLEGSARSDPLEWCSTAQVHVDDFQNVSKLIDCKELDYALGGLDLTKGPITYSKYYGAKAASDQTELIVAVAQRVLTITPTSITCQ